MKHGCYSVMAWEAIWSNRWSELMECEGNTKSNKFLHIAERTLSKDLKWLSGEMIKKNSLFMKDGASCQTDRMTKGLSDESDIKKLPWQSQLPDINLLNTSWT